MDSTQLSGYPPEEVASRIVRLVREQRNEDIPAPLLHRLVIYIRTLFPSLFFFIMQKRAKSQRKEKAKNDWIFKYIFYNTKNWINTKKNHP